MPVTPVTRERRFFTVLVATAAQDVRPMRTVAKAHLVLWDKAELTDLVLLGLSELLSNVVKHAPGDCEVRLRDVAAGVEVAVTDFAVGLPVVKEPTEEEPGGRGLFLLSQLVQELTVEPLDCGKQVRLLMKLPDVDDQEMDPRC
ncbi:ATP-binding protein [Kitasatospora sp. HPMI-4]|uniref:ATP-binding protein n=1 Tax=Kitasatospora sp. HPMI-4 TaxID=3448443 RepID=UPI003F1A2B13